MDLCACDRCGKPIVAGSGDHFVVHIEAFAAAGPLEITAEDLQKDHTDEIRRILEQLAKMPIEEVENGVYRAFRFNLCAACHRAYLRNPLGT